MFTEGTIDNLHACFELLEDTWRKSPSGPAVLNTHNHQCSSTEHHWRSVWLQDGGSHRSYLQLCHQGGKRSWRLSSWFLWSFRLWWIREIVFLKLWWPGKVKCLFKEVLFSEFFSLSAGFLDDLRSSKTRKGAEPSAVLAGGTNSLLLGQRIAVFMQALAAQICSIIVLL